MCWFRCPTKGPRSDQRSVYMCTLNREVVRWFHSFIVFGFCDDTRLLSRKVVVDLRLFSLHYGVLRQWLVQP